MEMGNCLSKSHFLFLSDASMKLDLMIALRRQQERLFWTQMEIPSQIYNPRAAPHIYG